MSVLAVEQTPDVADAAHEASDGRVVYITERGERVGGIVSADLATALEGLPADELEQSAAAVSAVGREDMAELLEDLADRAAVRESRAAGGPGTPWEQLKAEAEL
jgi:hypothetical protein